MNEVYTAGSYWGARQESAEQCAQRAQSFFRALARCDPFFDRWFLPPCSRNEAPRPFEPEGPALHQLLAEGRTRNDEGGIIEDLGFSLSVDNGTRPDKHPCDHAHLRIHCGSYVEPVGNGCVLNLSSTRSRLEQVLTVPLLMEVMRAMVLAWEPDWGVVSPRSYTLLTKLPAKGPRAGWLMYLSRNQGVVPPLPSPVRVEPFEERGTLIILTPDVFTTSNPLHVERAHHVLEALGQAGLIKPLQP